MPSISPYIRKKCFSKIKWGIKLLANKNRTAMKTTVPKRSGRNREQSSRNQFLIHITLYFPSMTFVPSVTCSNPGKE